MSLLVNLNDFLQKLASDRWTIEDVNQLIQQVSDYHLGNECNIETLEMCARFASWYSQSLSMEFFTSHFYSFPLRADVINAAQQAASCTRRCMELACQDPSLLEEAKERTRQLYQCSEKRIRDIEGYIELTKIIDNLSDDKSSTFVQEYLAQLQIIKESLITPLFEEVMGFQARPEKFNERVLKYYEYVFIKKPELESFNAPKEKKASLLGALNQYNPNNAADFKLSDQQYKKVLAIFNAEIKAHKAFFYTNGFLRFALIPDSADLISYLKNRVQTDLIYLSYLRNITTPDNRKEILAVIYQVIKILRTFNLYLSYSSVSIDNKVRMSELLVKIQNLKYDLEQLTIDEIIHQTRLTKSDSHRHAAPPSKEKASLKPQKVICHDKTEFCHTLTEIIIDKNHTLQSVDAQKEIIESRYKTLELIESELSSLDKKDHVLMRQLLTSKILYTIYSVDLLNPLSAEQSREIFYRQLVEYLDVIRSLPDQEILFQELYKKLTTLISKIGLMNPLHENIEQLLTMRDLFSFAPFSDDQACLVEQRHLYCQVKLLQTLQKKPLKLAEKNKEKILWSSTETATTDYLNRMTHHLISANATDMAPNYQSVIDGFQDHHDGALTVSLISLCDNASAKVKLLAILDVYCAIRMQYSKYQQNESFLLMCFSQKKENADSLIKKDAEIITNLLVCSDIYRYLLLECDKLDISERKANARRLLEGDEQIYTSELIKALAYKELSLSAVASPRMEEVKVAQYLESVAEPTSTPDLPIIKISANPSCSIIDKISASKKDYVFLLDWLILKKNIMQQNNMGLYQESVYLMNEYISKHTPETAVRSSTEDANKLAYLYHLRTQTHELLTRTILYDGKQGLHTIADMDRILSDYKSETDVAKRQRNFLALSMHLRYLEEAMLFFENTPELDYPLKDEQLLDIYNNLVFFSWARKSVALLTPSDSEMELEQVHLKILEYQTKARMHRDKLSIYSSIHESLFDYITTLEDCSKFMSPDIAQKIIDSCLGILPLIAPEINISCKCQTEYTVLLLLSRAYTALCITPDRNKEYLQYALSIQEALFKYSKTRDDCDQINDDEALYASYCQTLGASLASVKSKKETDEIQQKFKQVKLSWQRAGTANCTIYIEYFTAEFAQKTHFGHQLFLKEIHPKEQMTSMSNDMLVQLNLFLSDAEKKSGEKLILCYEALQSLQECFYLGAMMSYSSPEIMDVAYRLTKPDYCRPKMTPDILRGFVNDSKFTKVGPKEQLLMMILKHSLEYLASIYTRLSKEYNESHSTLDQSNGLQLLHEWLSMEKTLKLILNKLKDNEDDFMKSHLWQVSNDLNSTPSQLAGIIDSSNVQIDSNIAQITQMLLSYSETPLPKASLPPRETKTVMPVLVMCPLKKTETAKDQINKGVVATIRSLLVEGIVYQRKQCYYQAYGKYQHVLYLCDLLPKSKVEGIPDLRLFINRQSMAIIELNMNKIENISTIGIVLGECGLMDGFVRELSSLKRKLGETNPLSEAMNRHRLMAPSVVSGSTKDEGSHEPSSIGLHPLQKQG